MGADELVSGVLQGNTPRQVLTEALRPLATFTHGFGGVTLFNDGKRLHFDGNAPQRAILAHRDGSLTRPDRFGRIPRFHERYYASVYKDAKQRGLDLGPMSPEHGEVHQQILNGGKRDPFPQSWSVEKMFKPKPEPGAKPESAKSKPKKKKVTEAYRSFPIAGAAYGKLKSINNALRHVVEVGENGFPTSGALCGKVKPEHILDDLAVSDHAEAATCKTCLRRAKVQKS